MDRIVAPVFKKFGDRPVNSITKRDLLPLLVEITNAHPETGHRVRQRLRAIFANAYVTDLIEQNPIADLHHAVELQHRPPKVSHGLTAPQNRFTRFLQRLRGAEQFSAGARLAVDSPS